MRTPCCLCVSVCPPPTKFMKARIVEPCVSVCLSPLLLLCNNWVKELLYKLFCVHFMSYQRKVDDLFFLELLVFYSSSY
jgi:hypothetical protein